MINSKSLCPPYDVVVFSNVFKITVLTIRKNLSAKFEKYFKIPKLS